MKLAIVGSASSTVGEAPYGDSDWTIWGLAWCTYPRLDVAWEVHDPALWSMHGEGYMERLRGYGDRLMLRVPHPDLPAAQRYPMQQAADACFAEMAAPLRYPMQQAADGSFADMDAGIHPFTSSIGYMMALALAGGQCSEVALYGADLLLGSEYDDQQPAVAWLRALLLAEGVIVTIPPGSSCLRRRNVYGSAMPTAEGALPVDFLDARVTHYQQQQQEARDNMLRADGARREVAALLAYAENFRRGGIVPGT